MTNFFLSPLYIYIGKYASLFFLQHSHINVCSERYKAPTNTEHQRIGSPVSDLSMMVCPLCKGSFETRLFVRKSLSNRTFLLKIFSHPPKQSHKNVCSTNPSPSNTQTRFIRNASNRNVGRQPDGPHHQETGPRLSSKT